MVKCQKCQKDIDPKDAQKVENGYVCNDCARKKRNRILIICAILVACVIVGLVIWRMIANNEEERRISIGFDGVPEYNYSSYSINVNVEALEV